MLKANQFITPVLVYKTFIVMTITQTIIHQH